MQPETCSQPHSRQPHVANTLPSFCPIAFRPCRRPCGSSNAASKHAMLATAPRSLTPTNPSHTPRLPAAERRASVARRVSVWITTPTPHAPAGASECHSPPSNIPTPPHALMPNALMPTRFSPPVSLQRCLSTNAESRMPNAARYQSLTPQPRSIDVANSPNTTLRARTLLEIYTRGPCLCAQCVSSAPILLASHQTFCENAHLVARHESPSSSVRFKRRQSASNVEGDNAAGAPDDRASMDLAPTEPSTSGLGQLWRWAARPGRPNSQSPRGPRHDVERKLDKPKPANSGAPAAYPLCSSEESGPIIPRTRKLKAGPI